MKATRTAFYTQRTSPHHSPSYSISVRSKPVKVCRTEVTEPCPQQMQTPLNNYLARQQRKVINDINTLFNIKVHADSKPVESNQNFCDLLNSSKMLVIKSKHQRQKSDFSVTSDFRSRVASQESD